MSFISQITGLDWTDDIFKSLQRDDQPALELCTLVECRLKKSSLSFIGHAVNSIFVFDGQLVLQSPICGDPLGATIGSNLEKHRKKPYLG